VGEGVPGPPAPPPPEGGGMLVAPSPMGEGGCTPERPTPYHHPHPLLGGYAPQRFLAGGSRHKSDITDQLLHYKTTKLCLHGDHWHASILRKD